MITALQILAALLLDRLLGEPRRWHPLVGFGRLAGWLEARLYGTAEPVSAWRRLRGALAWGLAVVPPVAVTAMTGWLPAPVGIPLGIVVLYLAIGARSLAEHARAVEAALARQDLDAARTRTAYLVSRETGRLDAPDLRRATIESVLENGNDAVFGALFWFLVAGPAGAVLYRLANTLDAMWGYRNTRYRDFGSFAARMDDVLNWLPARLTALAYGLAGRTTDALRCWRTQATAWHGINPGVVMAAGAGALGMRLGGAAVYHGRERRRPTLGADDVPLDAHAIERSLRLLHRALGLWMLVILAGGFALA